MRTKQQRPYVSRSGMIVISESNKDLTDLVCKGWHSETWRRGSWIKSLCQCHQANQDHQGQGLAIAYGRQTVPCTLFAIYLPSIFQFSKFLARGHVTAAPDIDKATPKRKHVSVASTLFQTIIQGPPINHSPAINRLVYGTLISFVFIVFVAEVSLQQKKASLHFPAWRRCRLQNSLGEQ